MEQTALYQVFVRDYTRLCALAAGILRDEALAQDAVQESWLRLYSVRNLDTRDPEKLRHLVMLTVRHTACNMRRKNLPVPVEDAVLTGIPDAMPLPQEQAERAETIRLVWAAMQRLEETDRTILQLQYGQELNSRQIAAILEMKPAGVRQRARRARLAMKKQLEQEGLSL